jgi:hypothetical protein
MKVKAHLSESECPCDDAIELEFSLMGDMGERGNCGAGCGGCGFVTAKDGPFGRHRMGRSGCCC